MIISIIKIKETKFQDLRDKTVPHYFGLKIQIRGCPGFHD